MTAWTNYVKQYAKDKGITYKNALKDPACASSYKSGKVKPSVLTEPAKEDNIQMKIEEKPKRGRPKKYTTAEEAKKAKDLVDKSLHQVVFYNILFIFILFKLAKISKKRIRRS